VIVSVRLSMDRIGWGCVAVLMAAAVRAVPVRLDDAVGGRPRPGVARRSKADGAARPRRWMMLLNPGNTRAEAGSMARPVLDR
jgi:hypothetical protein